MKAIYSIISILIISFNLKAGDHYVFKNYSIPDGLPSTQVYQTIQDENNYLWLATDRGVCLYDGYTFKTFTRKHGLPDEVVFGFYLDENLRLWLYTYQGGICYYENGRFYEPDFNNELIRQLERSHGSPIITGIFRENGNTWISTESDHYLKINAKGKIEKISYEGIEVCEVYGKKDSALVYSGQIVLRPDVIQWVNKQNITARINLAPALSNATRRGRAKVFWIDASTLLVCYDAIVLKVNREGIIQQIELGADHTVLYAQLIDRSGNLWIGCRKGVYCFSNADLNSVPKHYLKNQPISSIWQDHEGGYWFSSLDDGVFYIPHFNIQSFEISDPDKGKPLSIISNKYGVYVSTSSWDILVFPKGDFGRPHTVSRVHSDGQRLQKYGEWVVTKVGSEYQSYFRDSIPEKTLHGNDVLLFHDTGPHCPYYMDTHITPDTFVFIPKPHSGKKDSLSIPMPSSGLNCIAASPDLGRVWTVYPNDVYEWHDGQWVSLKHIPHLGSRIADLDYINDSLLLITTRGSGLLLYNYIEKKVTKLEEPSNQYCHNSFVDSNGIIWVSSFSGVSRISNITSKNPLYYHFSVQNGLLSNEVHKTTEYQNNIWIATGRGINHWNLNWLPDQSPVNVEVKEMLVNDKKRKLSASVQLATDENHLQFRFSAISFQKPIRYHYRLKGIHSNWILTPQPIASYSALKPGNYIFEVKPAQSMTVHASIPFKIQSPFWQRWWFILSSSFLLMLLVFIFLRVRYRFIRKENQLFNLFIRAEQKALRAQVNPHFLFNSFNSILELLMQKDYLSVQKYMRKLAGLMRKALHFSRQEKISLAQEIDFLNQYVELEKLRFSSALDFKIKCTGDLQPGKTYLPPLLLQPYVENALKHGIRSRTDHAGQLYIVFTQQAEILKIEISDNGKGFRSQKNSRSRHISYGMKITGERIRLFDHTNNLKAEVKSLNPNDDEYPGTIVVLHLPLKLKTLYETPNLPHTDSRR